MNGEYRTGDVVLGSWTLVKLLGEGAYGKVYEAHREGFGFTDRAAIKIMTIPPSQSEVVSARAEGMDEESVTAYFRGMVEDVVQEFALMSRLKGMTNIVSCEDFQVEQHSEGIGWDILIRMELLTPMLNYMSGHEMTRADVIRLGVDMCKALELCQRYNIIHRDIKPENIFISDTGDYKRGDFGVARTLEKTTGGLSKKGTYTYMAPEVYREEKYGSSVDIYSLGIVLYRLLNNNRAPFLPAPPAPITHSERERALLRRISGEQLPPPANASGRLAEIVLKACAFEPKDRYSSPLDMRRELEAIQYGRGEDELIYGRDSRIRVERSAWTKQGEPDGDATVYEPRRGAAAEDEETVYEPRRPSEATDEGRTVAVRPGAAAAAKDSSPAPEGKKKKKTGLVAGIAAALVLVIAALIVLLPKLPGTDPRVSASPAAASAAPAAPTSEPAPETPAPTGSDGLYTVDGSWEYGSLRISAKDKKTFRVELTDERIPDGYPFSETPGKNEPSWNIIFVFGDEVSAQAYLGGGSSFSDLSTDFFFEVGKSTLYSPINGYTLSENTFRFDAEIPELIDCSVKDLKKVYVNLGTETPGFVDHYEFPADPSAADSVFADELWRELEIVPQGDGLQILSCRYRGGPEIEKIDLYTRSGNNGFSIFDIYFLNNDKVAAITAACSSSLMFSDEDIEIWRPFGIKYLKDMDIPSSPVKSASLNYGPLYSGDAPDPDYREYFLWFGVTSDGEIVSTIIVEVGVPGGNG